MIPRSQNSVPDRSLRSQNKTREFIRMILALAKARRNRSFTFDLAELRRKDVTYGIGELIRLTYKYSLRKTKISIEDCREVVLKKACVRK